MRIYKPRIRKNSPFMKENSFLAELKAKPTLSDKRSHVVEANPLLLIFGINLDPRNPYEGELNGQT